MTLDLVDEAVASGASLARTCREVGLNATTLQRWRRQGTGDDQRRGPASSPSNKLTAEERQLLIETSCSPEFRDLSASQIVPRLADIGQYIASESTFYRVLREEKLLNHRGRAKAPSKPYRPLVKVATGPCQVWSWDITYLASPIRGKFFYLYLIMDVWSRKIVGRQVHTAESPENAAALIAEACAAEGVERDQLILHSDNGGPMKGATMLATLQRLGVVPSFSRPRVSDDNPFSESLFRTLKYRPGYPSKPFTSAEAASEWVDGFAGWYNNEHLHSGIRFVTPADRHAERHHEVLEKRRQVYETARTRNPQRWRGNIRNLDPIQTVLLNPEPEAEATRPAA